MAGESLCNKSNHVRIRHSPSHQWQHRHSQSCSCFFSRRSLPQWGRQLQCRGPRGRVSSLRAFILNWWIFSVIVYAQILGTDAPQVQLSGGSNRYSGEICKKFCTVMLNMHYFYLFIYLLHTEHGLSQLFTLKWKGCALNQQLTYSVCM